MLCTDFIGAFSGVEPEHLLAHTLAVQKPACLRPVAQVPCNSAQVSLTLCAATVIELCFGTWILTSEFLLPSFPPTPPHPHTLVSLCLLPPRSCPRPPSAPTLRFLILLPFHWVSHLLPSAGRRPEAAAPRRREAGKTGAMGRAAKTWGERRVRGARGAADWLGRRAESGAHAPREPLARPRRPGPQRARPRRQLASLMGRKRCVGESVPRWRRVAAG